MVQDNNTVTVYKIKIPTLYTEQRKSQRSNILTECRNVHVCWCCSETYRTVLSEDFNIGSSNFLKKNC